MRPFDIIASNVKLVKVISTAVSKCILVNKVFIKPIRCTDCSNFSHLVIMNNK